MGTVSVQYDVAIDGVWNPNPSLYPENVNTFLLYIYRHYETTNCYGSFTLWETDSGMDWDYAPIPVVGS